MPLGWRAAAERAGGRARRDGDDGEPREGADGRANAIRAVWRERRDRPRRQAAHADGHVPGDSGHLR